MSIKLVARLLLIFIVCMILTFLVCGIVASDACHSKACLQEATAVSVSTTTLVTQSDASSKYTEPSETPSAEDITDVIGHLLRPDIQYIVFSSVDEAKEYVNDVVSAITLIADEYHLYSDTEAYLAVITDEKARLEEVLVKTTNDIDMLLKEIEKHNNNESVTNKPSTKPIIKDEQVDIESAPDTDYQKNEYKYATIVWEYLKSVGYSDAVCAGIIGNFMTETGGHTLALNPTLYSNGGRYYGIAQWSLKYYPDVDGASLNQQLAFLSGNIEKEFDMFGYKYKKGFTYSDFLNLDSPRAAALAFAKVYERCGSGSYSKRQAGAELAYDYFT